MGKYGLNSVSVCLSVLQTSLDVVSFSKLRCRESPAGFTIVELAISLAIVATLTAITVPITQDYIYKAKVARAATEIRGLEKEIIFFKTERGRLPGWEPSMLDTLQEIGQDNFPDPWGTPYQYRNLELAKIDSNGKPQGCRKDRSRNPLNYDFDLYSVGPDRWVPTQLQVTANHGADDIIRAGNGSYVGEASKF